MFSKQASRLLTRADRQALHLQWLRNGQRKRCFHASSRHRAAERSDEPGTSPPPNAPKRGPTRQQRAAMISEEVQMLQRDHPSPSFSEADPNTLRPAGASQTVDPGAVGEDVPARRMGENDTTTQEGPQAQGAARVVAADEDVPDSTGLARGVRSPHDAVEEPQAGGAAVLDGREAQAPVGEVTEVPRSTTPAPAQANTSQTPHQPEPISANDLLLSNSTPATMAGAGPESIINERINTIANAGMLDDTRSIGYLAHRLMDGQLVRFHSKEEKAAVEEAAKKIAEERTRATYKVRERFDNTKQPTHKFAPLPKSVLQEMANSNAAGRYRGYGLLHGKRDSSKRPLLNNISRLALQNGTYLQNDRVRFLAKVRSLLPKPAPPKQKAKKA
ncbi:uncharacterized protein LTR77_003643 [Saxophila tyrrhenica]|uniref:Uncharacterized protein n=1 Tax=Saxophila tyrrhenica TaxID=1690608 RepID=A0AAV9PHM9_9PEZI|nr:hypothetical protein LTR77_003643 [Saxophila tyrrhenica]